MAKPTVAIRIGQVLYDEVVSIAESRDCTITQALDIYIQRLQKEKESGTGTGTGTGTGNEPTAESQNKKGNTRGRTKGVKPRRKIVRLIDESEARESQTSREAYTGREKPKKL